MSKLNELELTNEKLDKLVKLIDEFESILNTPDLDSNSMIVKNLILSGERRKGLQTIREFTKDANRLIIVDPYLFSGNENENEYLSELISTTRIQNLDSICFIFDSSHSNNKKLKSQIKRSSERCKISYVEFGGIHDRIWIKDRSEALIIGTSLGGVGKSRLSFILSLPNEDLTLLLQYLDDNNLIK